MLIAIAQMAPRPGDLEANERRILAAIDGARRAGAALVVTSGAALTGGFAKEDSPPEASREVALARIRAIARRTAGLALAVGVGLPRSGALDVAIAADGRLVSAGGVSHGPGAGTSGGAHRLLDVAGRRFGVVDEVSFSVDEVIAAAIAEGAVALVVVAASPFGLGGQVRREHRVAGRARALGVPILFVNTVGVDGARAWDGASFAVAGDGTVAQRLPAWWPTLALCRFEDDPKRVRGDIDHRDEHNVMQALVLAMRCRAERSGNGRIEVPAGTGPRALLARLAAVDAVGPERVVVGGCSGGTGALEDWPLLANLDEDLVRRAVRERSDLGRLLSDEVLGAATATCDNPPTSEPNPEER